MAQRKIIIEPDTILRKKSETLEKVNNELRSLMDDMLETMYAAPGIGLAAVQVGILKRLIVIDISKDKEKKNPLFLINPEIVSKSNKTSIYEEGCLSLPGVGPRTCSGSHGCRQGYGICCCSDGCWSHTFVERPLVGRAATIRF